MMRRLAVALAAIVLASSAGAEEKAAAAKEQGPMEMQRAGPGQATSRQVEKMRAKVTAIDPATRQITLQGPKGKTETFKVSPVVKRLEEIQVGDDVNVKYERGLALQFQQPTEKDLEPSVSGVAERAGPEAAPAGTATMQVRSTVTVTAVDQKKRIVVLEGPGGNLYKVKAGPDIKLQKVKAGQKFYAVYTESLAVSIEKAKPAAGATTAK